MFKGNGDHELWLRGSAWVSSEEKNYNRFNIVKSEGGTVKLSGISGFILGSDMTVAGGCFIDANSSADGNAELKLNGHKVTVKGDFGMYRGGVINVDKSELIVEGELNIPSGRLIVGSGHVKTGTYLNINNGINSSNGTGQLWMTDKKGLVEVGKDLWYRTDCPSKNNLTAGRIVINGNHEVRFANNQGCYYSEEIVVAFKGTKEDHIMNVAESDRINIVEIEKGGTVNFYYVGMKGNPSYTMTSSNKAVASVEGYKVKGLKDGTVTLTCKSEKQTVKITLIVGKGGSSSSGSSTVVNEKKPGVAKVESVSGVFSRGKITLKWKKLSEIDGCTVQISTNSSFKNAKTIQVKKTAVKYVFEKENGKTLKKGKKYYVRIRAYKNYKSGGKTKKAYGKYVVIGKKLK